MLPSWREYCKERNIRVKPTDIIEMDYLTSKGKIFMADFGLDNCHEKAIECMIENDMSYVEVPPEILARMNAKQV